MQKPKIIEETRNNILIKHLSAVHSSSTLTMLQRKTYNILLKHAIKHIHEDRVHKISIKEFKQALGWSDKSNTTEDLKEKLKALSRSQVEWNILGKDKKNKWTASTLLADVSIKDGDIYYSYSLSLQALFSSPNIYAKLNMEVQKKLTNKYALIVWEVICGDLSLKNENQAVSEWMSYDKILKLLDLKGTCYEKRYALFRSQVLEVAIKEINEQSDMNVVVEEVKERRAIKSLRFITERKGVASKVVHQKIIDYENPVCEKLKALGFLDRTVSELIKKHDQEDLFAAIAFYEHHIENSKQALQNPVAFFQKALEKGWVAPLVKNSATVDAAAEFSCIKSEIEQLSETKDCKNIRLCLLEHIGVAQYKSWFLRCQFRVFNNQLFIESKSQFECDYLRQHFQTTLTNVAKNYKSTIAGVEILSQIGRDG